MQHSRAFEYVLCVRVGVACCRHHPTSACVMATCTHRTTQLLCRQLLYAVRSSTAVLTLGPTMSLACLPVLCESASLPPHITIRSSEIMPARGVMAMVRMAADRPGC